MTGKLREDWQKAKKEAEKHGVPKDFFNHADLGPKLDKAEKALNDYDNYTGGDPAKTDKLKKAAAKAIKPAEQATLTYAKNAKAAKRHAENHALQKAFDDLETVLAMNIYHVLSGWSKRV